MRVTRAYCNLFKMPVTITYEPAFYQTMNQRTPDELEGDSECSGRGIDNQEECRSCRAFEPNGNANFKVK
ncbi:hypothetical protein DFP93_105173 [Aneurinibacillus soli]|uniref:Uncharacterized protein n=1 Tax=Aneurinibacillus soli TaxID=1500254 RepID=A0A0U5B1Y0_9BACL|nr:hypothetical protein DFP93_105173 [Aneurinibacillus soli]BAU28594.1 hypothetical protein CB4_02769 [Aneurinibacillus soli]